MMAVLPYSLPGTVMAIGCILAWSGAFFGITLYNTIWIILAAYIARYLSYVLKSSSAALQQIHGSLEEAARSCGATHMDTLRDVTLPLIKPAMISGFFLVFLPCMRELTTSILLYGPNSRTLRCRHLSVADQWPNLPPRRRFSSHYHADHHLQRYVKALTKDRKRG